MTPYMHNFKNGNFFTKISELEKIAKYFWSFTESRAQSYLFTIDSSCLKLLNSDEIMQMFYCKEFGIFLSKTEIDSFWKSIFKDLREANVSVRLQAVTIIYVCQNGQLINEFFLF